MTRTILAFFALCALAGAEERPSVKCSENSPERRGEEGCSILVSRPLTASTGKPLYWHVDRFDTLEAATRAAGPDGVPVDAHGSAWLLTVEPRGEHRGGRHAAWIGPLTLPRADSYTMRVQSSLLRPETTTPVHTHSGPEVFYVVSGEQCLDTPEKGHRLRTGQTHIVPTGAIHRGRVTGSAVRGVLALILHDSALPASHDLADPPKLALCK